MKNRILSIILTLVMLVSAVSVFVVPASAANVASDFDIQPIVLLGGDDEYNIVWKNNFAGKGYITYEYNDKDYTVWDEENGVVRGEDYMHTVRVPQEHINQCRNYTIHATNGTTTFEFAVEGFNGLGDGTIDVGIVSDVHFRKGSGSLNNTNLDSMLSNIDELFQKDLKTEDGNTPELRMLLGDISDSLASEEELDGLYKILSKAGCDGDGSPGQYPVLYVVGNHEKRGAYTHDIDKYLSYNTGEFYGYFEFGPMSFYVSDIGEDKPDSNPEYTASATDPIGLIDMERYYAEQYQYFASHKGFNADKPYTFTVSHAPNFVGSNYSAATTDSFFNLFNKYGTDLHMFGHWHEQTFYDGINIPTSDYDKTTYESVKKEDGTMSSVTGWGTYPFPGINVGASGNYTADERGVLLRLEDGIYSFTAMNEDGVTKNWTASVDANANGAPSAKEDVEEVLPEDEETGITIDSSTATVPTALGVSTAELKSASATTAITTAPVVFDAGNYYNIVWQTADICAGYVDVDGVSKTYMDHYAGVLRHTKRETSKIHSVRIPKSKLDGKSYAVKNRAITSDYICGYGKYVTDSETGERVIETYDSALTFGAYSWGSAIDFVDQPSSSSDKYTVVAVGGDADFAAVKASLTEVPNLVVLTGDVVDALNTEADFGALLTKINALTGGNCPVMLLRGEGEATGDYAAELPAVLHNFASAETINKMYTTSKTGALSVIGLDTPVESLIDEQVDWLANDLTSSFAGKYNLAFANAANDDMAASFTSHNVQLSVTAGDTSALTNGGNSYSEATVAADDALVITCENGEVDVVSVNSGALDTFDTSEVVNAEAKIGETYYKTLADAIAAAKSGNTITLLTNVKASTVIVRSGRTLDLNGYSLESALVFGSKGSNLIDSSADKTGRLVAEQGTVELAADNDQLPVYDAKNGYYVFTTISTVVDGEARYDYSPARTVNGKNLKYVYRMTPFLYEKGNMAERAQTHALLKEQYDNTGVEIAVRLAFEDSTGNFESDQDFRFTSSYINTYVTTSDTQLTDNAREVYGRLVVNFASSVLNQGINQKAYTVIKSDTGVEIVSAPTDVTE